MHPERGGEDRWGHIHKGPAMPTMLDGPAVLEKELLRMGITQSWSGVTKQEKALARPTVEPGGRAASRWHAQTDGLHCLQMRTNRAEAHLP